MDKSATGDKVNWTENGEHVKTEKKTAEVLNSFFLKYSKESQDSPVLKISNIQL